MRKRAALIPILSSFISAGTAFALDAGVSVRCENGQHTVSVSGTYLEEYDGAITGIVFQREVLGLCAEPEYVPETPLPFEPRLDYGSVYYYQASTAIEVPTTDFAFRYTPYGVRPDGTLVPTTYSCDNDNRNYALANCGGAPVGRGRLELDDEFVPEPRVELIPCTDSCWSEPIWLGLSKADDASEGPVEALIGEVVTVYGGLQRCAMPGGDAYAVTLIERAPEGVCSSLPIRDHTWGVLKASYD